MNIATLETRRLLLRPVTITDWEAIHALNSMPETNRYNPSGIPENVEQSQFAVAAWVAENEKEASGRLTFAIMPQDNDTLIGLAGITLGKGKYRNAEVWYKFHSAHWGLGYATEVLQAILDFGFGPMKLHRIEAGCAVENVASWRVLEKVGMQREARRRELLPLQGGWADNYEYAILETDERTAAGR